MPVSEPYKKEFTFSGKTTLQTVVDVTCPHCGNIRTVRRTEFTRQTHGEFCNMKCQRDMPKLNTNWWEDAYNEDHRKYFVRGGSGGLNSGKGAYSNRHFANRDGNFRGYDIVMDKAMRV